jgi:hypothetical protein
MPKNEVHVPVNDGECYPVDQATCILQEAAPLWQSHLHTRIHTTTVSLAPYLNLRLRALKTWQEFQVKAAQYNPIMYIIYPVSIYLSLCLSVCLSVYLSIYPNKGRHVWFLQSMRVPGWTDWMRSFVLWYCAIMEVYAMCSTAWISKLQDLGIPLKAWVTWKKRC